MFGTEQNDNITGSNGANLLMGGGGHDKLIGNAGTDILIGGAENDTLISGGGVDRLYGGQGADTFVTSDSTFVMDASTDDRVIFNSAVLTGGVAKPWDESGWATSGGLFSLMPNTPAILGGIFGALAAVTFSTAMRGFTFGLTETGQLIVRFAEGRGGQIVIENYKLDLDTGQGTGGIVAFRQIIGKASLADYGNQNNAFDVFLAKVA